MHHHLYSLVQIFSRAHLACAEKNMTDEVWRRRGKAAFHRALGMVFALWASLFLMVACQRPYTGPGPLAGEWVLDKEKSRMNFVDLFLDVKIRCDETGLFVFRFDPPNYDRDSFVGACMNLLSRTALAFIPREIAVVNARVNSKGEIVGDRVLIDGVETRISEAGDRKNVARGGSFFLMEGSDPREHRIVMEILEPDGKYFRLVFIRADNSL